MYWFDNLWQISDHQLFWPHEMNLYINCVQAELLGSQVNASSEHGGRLFLSSTVLLINENFQVVKSSQTN